MAEALIGGALLGDAVGKLSTAIIKVLQKTWYFKSKLNEIQDIIKLMTPIFADTNRLDEELDRRGEDTKKLNDLLENARHLVQKCEHVRLNLWKRYRYASKLESFRASLLDFTQIYVPLVLMRDVRQVLVNSNVNGSSIGCSRVPLLHGTVIGFDDQVGELKALVLNDSVGDECSVVLVSAAGGYGKTTLVTMLCDDSEIKGIFGDNIYFVTISSSPNIKVAVKSLLERNVSHSQLDFTSEGVALQQWGSFLRDNNSPVLLVLDDVWHHSVIKKFKFKSSNYKIVVTSRTAFTQYNKLKYEVRLLSHQHACDLFRHSAFPEPRTDITDELVEKLVNCCKNHPLALVVIGGMLNGAPLASWEILSNDLCIGNQSVWDSEDFMKLCLEKSLDLFKEDTGIKQCYLDLGLFPEDHKIAATTLMDIWAHLYNHDEQGKATRDMLFKLSLKNLATHLPIREHLPAIVNHCEDETVAQHDMMRAVAIRLSSQGSVKYRERFIIKPDGKDLPLFRKTINARLLSISTDERSSLRWKKNIKFPKVEVLVLNFMSKTHPLPRFMKNMKRLKVLIITNYGYNVSELENFPEPKKLSGLTTIRLDHVSISSISSSILELENLKKLSLIMCKIGNSFNESTARIPNKLPSLVELVIDSCDDFVTFPAMLCNLVHLKKLSITKCHNLTSLSDGFGNLTNLEVLRLASCLNLTMLPESLKNLGKLGIIDLSDCLSLQKLPEDIGVLRSLKTIYVSGCRELQEPPESVKDLQQLNVYCDKENLGLWTDRQNVEVEVVEDDPLDTFRKIMPSGYKY